MNNTKLICPVCGCVMIEFEDFFGGDESYCQNCEINSSEDNEDIPF